MTNPKWSAHTPWTAEDTGVYDARGDRVAWAFGYNNTGRPAFETAQARAHAIAALPDMYEALETILPFIPKSSAKDGGASAYSENVQAADKVRAALAKARGEWE